MNLQNTHTYIYIIILVVLPQLIIFAWVRAVIYTTNDKNLCNASRKKLSFSVIKI